MAEKNKLSIICMSGDFDKAIAVFTLASGAAAVNYEVNLFFTFWGLNNIKKNKGRGFIGKGVLARFFNFLLGGEEQPSLEPPQFRGRKPRAYDKYDEKPQCGDPSRAVPGIACPGG
jgi:peroxiredoxin family protein